MKKILALCCLCAALSIPATAQAAGYTSAAYEGQTANESTVGSTQNDGIGIYVTPKIIWGYGVMDKVKGEAHVESGGIDAGASKKSRKSDDTWGGAIAVGYDFHRLLDVPVRGEIEYAFFGNIDGSVSRSYDNGGISGSSKLKQKMDIQTLFFNAYWDFKNDSPITPYIGAGLGLAFVDSKASGSTDYTIGGANFSGNSSTNYKLNTNFAWNVGAGVAWELNELLALDLGYKFASLGKTKTRESSYEGLAETVSYKSKVTDLYMHQVMLGLRFTF